MSALAVCTIAASNYFAHAKALVKSFLSHHPDLPFFIASADPPGDGLDADCGECKVLGLSELGITTDTRFLFQFSRKQLAVLLKPVVLRHLLSQGFESVLFLDPDMLVFHRLDDLLDAARTHSLTLTPHVGPAADSPDRSAREKQLLLAGIYNGGVLGVRNRPETVAFLKWLEERLRTHCHDDVREGVHYDQRWLDLAPAFIEDIHFFRDPGINVAYWNLPDRRIESVGGVPSVDGRPIRLFHFSGYDPRTPQQAARYRNDLSVDVFGPVAALFDEYRKRLEAEGFAKWTQSPWPWNAFSNGVPIPEIARDYYQSLGAEARRFNNPFDVDANPSFFQWLNESPDGCPYPELHLSRLWRYVYNRTSELHKEFPDPLGADRIHYLRWTVLVGARHYGIPPELAMPPARRSLAGYVLFTALMAAAAVRRVLFRL